MRYREYYVIINLDVIVKVIVHCNDHIEREKYLVKDVGGLGPLI